MFVNNICVLGYTHQDVVSLFQTIPPGDTVTLEICRGYSLPFDPDDPNTEIVTTVAVTLPQDGQASGSGPSYSALSGTDLNSSNRSLKSLPDLARSANINSNMSFSQHSMPGDLKCLTQGNGPPDLVSVVSKPEILSINIVRGPMGFGFTIADSPYGQKVSADMVNSFYVFVCLFVCLFRFSVDMVNPSFGGGGSFSCSFFVILFVLVQTRSVLFDFCFVKALHTSFVDDHLFPGEAVIIICICR